MLLDDTTNSDVCGKKGKSDNTTVIIAVVCPVVGAIILGAAFVIAYPRYLFFLYTNRNRNSKQKNGLAKKVKGNEGASEIFKYFFHSKFFLVSVEQ